MHNVTSQGIPDGLRARRTIGYPPAAGLSNHRFPVSPNCRQLHWPVPTGCSLKSAQLDILPRGPPAGPWKPLHYSPCAFMFGCLEHPPGTRPPHATGMAKPRYRVPQLPPTKDVARRVALAPRGRYCPSHNVPPTGGYNSRAHRNVDMMQACLCVRVWRGGSGLGVGESGE